MISLLADEARPAAHVRENEINPPCNATIMQRHAEQFVRPEVSIAGTEVSANAPRGRDKCKFANNSLLYFDAPYNACDFISRENGSETSDKNYEDGMPSEIRACKLDEGKIYDCHAEASCVSASCKYKRATRNKPREKTVKSYHVSSKDQSESRCRSNRMRKRTRCQTPEGIIIDLSNDLAGTKRGGIKISVISMHNFTSNTRFVAISKRGFASKQRKRPRSSTRDSKRKKANKTIGGPVLAVFYTANRGGMRKTDRSVKRPCSSQRAARYERIGSTNEMRRLDVDAIAHTADQSGNALNGRPELRAPDNSRSFCTSDEILDSMKCCHRDTALLEADNARCLISSARQADASGHTAELCCSILNNQHTEYHVCEQENYNAYTSDFNAETQADWQSFDCANAEGCRRFCDSCGHYSGMNMQLDRHRSIPSRAIRLLRSSAPPEQYQRERIEQFGSGELQAASVTAEFATKADEYSRDRDERCASCNETEASRSSASTIQKCTASKTSVFVEAGRSVDDLRDPCDANAPQCEIEADLEEFEQRTTTVPENENDEWPHKSDSSRSGFVDSCATTTDSCIRRCCESPDRSPGETGGFARGGNPKWMRDSIETDAQQLDYKWKRRIATIDDGARASVDFKGKRDSRYKSEEAIRVQLRERVEIRKRESLQMVEATSRGDNANANGKRRDYSLWTSLQMGKIWSQMHDACRNIAKLAATNVNRVIKDAPKSERSRRNPEVEELADAVYPAGMPSSHAAGICGEACPGNLMRSNISEKSEAYEKERDESTEVSMRKKLRASSGAYRNSKNLENERERDEYRDVVELLTSRNETCGHDEAAYPQFRLSDSFTYLEDSVDPEFRSRGGSDDNRDFARSIEDKQQEAARRRSADIEEAGSVGHQNSVSENCVYHTGSQTYVHCVDNLSSLCTVASHEFSAIPDDMEDVPGSNPLHRELQSATAFFPETGEQMLEAHVNLANVEAERELEETMPEIVGVVEATISSTQADIAIHSSRNDPDEPIASTSTWEPSFTSPRESQTSHTCATTMRFWKRRRQPVASNKAIAPEFKRKIRNAGRKKRLLSAATTHNGETKITQIEPSTVQTAGESNKRRAYVNVRMQTSGAIVTRILSELLGEGEKTKGVLMSITLQPESNDDVSDRKEAETQTPSSDVTSVGTDASDCPDRCPPTLIATRTVQCFVCNKRDCYEIKHSNDSNSLDGALIAEYSEETLEKNDIAKKRSSLSF